MNNKKYDEMDKECIEIFNFINKKVNKIRKENNKDILIDELNYIFDEILMEINLD